MKDKIKQLSKKSNNIWNIPKINNNKYEEINTDATGGI